MHSSSLYFGRYSCQVLLSIYLVLTTFQNSFWLNEISSLCFILVNAVLMFDTHFMWLSLRPGYYLTSMSSVAYPLMAIINWIASWTVIDHLQWFLSLLWTVTFKTPKLIGLTLWKGYVIKLDGTFSLWFSCQPDWLLLGVILVQNIKFIILLLSFYEVLWDPASCRLDINW